jgi:hypothetical protein
MHIVEHRMRMFHPERTPTPTNPFSMLIAQTLDMLILLQSVLAFHKV